MRIKICYGHQTNIPLTILPFHHSHIHGKHLYSPHSGCHQNSPRAEDLSSFIMVNILIMLFFIHLSHQACGRRKPDPSFCHSQHNPIKEEFLMWWVCDLTQRASFTAHWWRRLALLHEGIWNMGCSWLAGSWTYLRIPHAFIYDSPSEIFPNLPLLRDLSNLCCSAAKLPLQYLFPLLAWGKHF